MDVLISFYLEGDLSNNLKQQVEEHLKKCSNCRAKYDIIKSMFSDLKNCFDIEENSANKNEFNNSINNTTSSQYRLFQNNLSAYIDNELTNDENIKIKKFTINNRQARKDLEENYGIRKLMGESFRKTKEETRFDCSKNILKQLEIEDEDSLLGIHPALKILISFTFAVLILTTLVLMSLTD